MTMETKKFSFKSSEELAKLNLAKLSLPEYFVYKTPTSQQSQSTRALTLPDVFNLSGRSALTSKGTRAHLKSIANPNPPGTISIL